MIEAALDNPIAAPYDAGDPAAVRRAKRDAGRKALERESTIRAMLATPAARAWAWDFLSTCGVFRADFLSDNALQFATGQRNIGLMLLAQIPSDLYKMMSDEAKLKDHDNGK